MKDSNTLKRWELVKTRPGPDLTLFRARFDWLENPRNSQTVKATVLQAPDWVNVVALTPAGKLVVVEQYRFGCGEVTVEIPAGIIEAGEDSRQATVRELAEETGYTSDKWDYLGWVAPNPAYLDNRCHHWLAREAELTRSPALEVGEDLQAFELSLEEIKGEIAAGRFRHSLAVTALAHVLDLRDLLGEERTQAI